MCCPACPVVHVQRPPCAAPYHNALYRAVPQVCGGILMKLLMDLWVAAGPLGSFTLVLRMLRAALRSAQPRVRARAFDVLYNLAAHGAMLRTEAEEEALAAAGAQPLTAVAWQVRGEPDGDTGLRGGCDSISCLTHVALPCRGWQCVCVSGWHGGRMRASKGRWEATGTCASQQGHHTTACLALQTENTCTHTQRCPLLPGLQPRPAACLPFSRAGPLGPGVTHAQRPAQPGLQQRRQPHQDGGWRRRRAPGAPGRGAPRLLPQPRAADEPGGLGGEPAGGHLGGATTPHDRMDGWMEPLHSHAWNRARLHGNLHCQPCMRLRTMPWPRGSGWEAGGQRFAARVPRAMMCWCMCIKCMFI